ncbi:DUF5627 domain-containing protein [Flavobacterium eburneipallidum]|uniref:DUF5627 domain-containing protein n=1 Tax=Flavobacterium eburneipallidum TaxID=3003263 RepID=UPI002482A191|nr:DUF5627 domain-containing protein [Flavobacterium eburneipallidum]
MKKLILFLLILISVVGCENDPISYPDYDYSSVYFPYQFPVRTITLGEDIYDNTLDLQFKCNIMATMSGVYENKKDIAIDFIVADTIPKGYKFVGTSPLRPILPMPRDYYTLASNQILIKKGDISGGVEVQLTDKFFADPLATQNNYVIPLIMTTAVGVDSILQGKPLVANTKPRRLDSRQWDKISKDYILYAVKYINTWHGYYLRRGKDVMTGSLNKTIVRHPKDVQTYDAATSNVATWLVQLTTGSLKVLKFPVVLQDGAGVNYTCTLNLTFDDAGKCVITSSDPTAFTASGTGVFVKKGEKNSFGNVDRDVLYLDYTINHIAKNINTQTKDTLLMRNRGVVKETFTVVK